MGTRSTRIIPAAVLTSLVVCAAVSPAPAGPPADPPRRIVSMAPSTTEILFALGAGDRVVGVTRFCDYPEAARSLPDVGGFYDPNYEAIVALEPDLVVLLDSHGDFEARLERLGLETTTVPHTTVADIYAAVRSIGEVCGAAARAETLVAELNERMRAVRDAVAGRPRPRVLVCVGRDTGAGDFAGMYVAGRNDFYEELIETAGGINACESAAVDYPQMSAEGVIDLNPDVIVDLVGDLGKGGTSKEEIERQWEILRPVAAVRDGNVHVVTGDHALRPGLRSVDFLEQLARLLHPEVFDGGDG